MSGIRLGARAVLGGSPPYTVLEDGGPADGNYNVWRVLDGVPTRLTNYTDPLGVSPPFSDEMNNARLSPNGLWVVYNENFPGVNGGSVIDVVSATLGEQAPTRIWDDEVGNWALYPTWHPDNDKIVFVGDLGGGFAGKILRVSRTAPGAAETVLWTPQIQTPTQREGAYRPHYNFDGTKIAFFVTLDAGGGGDPSRQGLWVMDADGSNAALIDSFASGANVGRGYGKTGTQLAWANTQNKILYSNDDLDGTVADLFIINADGTGKTKLNDDVTTDARHMRVGWGAWADDDSFVIASGFKSGVGYVPHRFEADGSGFTELPLSASLVAWGDAHWAMYHRHVQDNRLYFRAGNDLGRISSIAIDGSDYRIDHDLSDSGVGTQFFSGTGFEWL